MTATVLLLGENCNTIESGRRLHFYCDDKEDFQDVLNTLNGKCVPFLSIALPDNQVLDTVYSRIDSIPKEISDVQCIERLCIYNSRGLKNFEILKDQENLHYLDLSNGTDLDSKGLVELSQLDTLILIDCSSDSFDFLFEMNNLRYLSIVGCDLPYTDSLASKLEKCVVISE